MNASRDDVKNAASSLKDSLLKLAEDSSAKKCRIGELFCSLDDDTKKAFRSVMCSEATTVDIRKLLLSSGIRVDRTYLGSKRECFRSGLADCCIYPENGVGND